MIESRDQHVSDHRAKPFGFARSREIRGFVGELASFPVSVSEECRLQTLEMTQVHFQSGSQSPSIMRTSRLAALPSALSAV